MAIIFAALFFGPKAAKMFVSAYRAVAQSSGITLQYVDPPNGYPGTNVNLIGTGFTANNTVNFGNFHITNVTSSDGRNLTFTVPTTLPNSNTEFPPGNYNVSVTNSSGATSNAYSFTVICQDLNCDDQPPTTLNASSSNTSGYTGPIYLCTSGQNCIEGFKVPIGGIADAQTITLDGSFVATTTSYSFDGLSPGLHTVTVSVPDGWFSGYTLCINSIDCHFYQPIQGNSVSVNFLSSNVPPYLDSNGLLNVPANAYIDLYWHFSQTFSDFAAAPTELHNQIGGGTGTSTVINGRQVASYTGGNVFGIPGSTAAGGPPLSTQLSQAIAAAAPNALGCTMGQILTPAIRSIIAQEQSLLGVQPERGSGGGGASIIINDIGSTGPLSRFLPRISGFTRSSAEDIRYIRAATVGFQNSPSWDAVAYCLQNAMIKYVQQSTTNWMYTAFNGNPAFIQNLGQFMLGVQDQTARNYIQNLVSHGNGAPFNNQIAQVMVNMYNNKGAMRSYDAAAVNQPGLAGWFALTQNDQNNIYDSFLARSDELNSAISNRNGQETLNYLANNGTLNSVSCDGSPTPDRYGQPTNCLTQNTGNLTNQAYGATAYLAQQRAANTPGHYDQVIYQLINQLVQTVLSKVFH